MRVIVWPAYDGMPSSVPLAKKPSCRNVLSIWRSCSSGVTASATKSATVLPTASTRAGLRGIRNELSGARPSGDRKSVVLGKSVAERVDVGGRRIIKKKNER